MIKDVISYMEQLAYKKGKKDTGLQRVIPMQKDEKMVDREQAQVVDTGDGRSKD